MGGIVVAVDVVGGAKTMGKERRVRRMLLYLRLRFSGDFPMHH